MRLCMASCLHLQPLGMWIRFGDLVMSGSPSMLQTAALCTSSCLIEILGSDRGSEAL